MPIAPAPTTTIRLGTVVSSSAWRLVMIFWPSIVIPGSERGRAPVAMMMFWASSSWPDGSTRTCLGPTKVAVPWMCVTPFFLNKKPIPFTSRSDTCRLRLWATA